MGETVDLAVRQRAGILRVSVLMPTFEQSAFIPRGVDSLLAQSLEEWELIIVDDGSRDETEQAVLPYLSDGRVHYHRFPENRGLGAALNFALDRAAGPMIAYLPSDDLYYRDHLASLIAVLEEGPGAVLAFSGVRHHYNRASSGPIDGYPLQLVQVVHRKTEDRWLEREQLVTDDLDRMYWSRLGARGPFVGTGVVTCEWVDHPGQRHKVLQEPVGGINPYRLRYRVRSPLRFHTTTGNLIDEVEQYRSFRERPDTPMAPDGLKVLLVGELAYNADRVLALEERGHRLYGLWMRDPYWYNTVGPLPFGHVQDLSPSSWQEEIRRIRPDVIYALLNWQAVPFAHEVLCENPGVPFVWHFKEGPFICLEKGTWQQLIDLYSRSDGQIYSSPEMRDWFETVIPGITGATPNLVLDGDLPKAEWFAGEPSPRLSEEDGEIHTVVPGRPIGLHPHNVAELAAEGVHLHFYGDFTHGQWKGWIDKTRAMAGGRLHLHANVDQRRWVSEFSRYDAGWLHFFESENGGELRRANWDDLNYPARISTLAAAGLPLLQRDNTGSIVATQKLARDLGIGVFARDMEGVASELKNRDGLEQARENVERHRPLFTFDHHADKLTDFFRRVVREPRGNGNSAASI